MKVAVAGQACVLLLGIDGGYCFDGVRTILLYPGSYHQPPQWQTHQLLVDEELAMQGEAWHRGPIVLSWDQVLANSRGQSDGQSLVIHEFSHHLDGLDGEVGGTPPLARPADYQRWNQVMSTEFQQLEYSARRGEPTLLDPYGASDPAEFFAVASECFFEEPCEMRSVHPDLYDLLKGFYRLDPQAWFPPGGPEQT
jgi:Mlc titration factor MtfA (ptsG expression regulator)